MRMMEQLSQIKGTLDKRFKISTIDVNYNCRRTLLIFKYDDDSAELGTECAIYLDNGVTDLV